MSVFGGDQWRPLLHVKDVANAIDNTIEGSVNGIFNLHHKNYKIIGLAEKIKEKIPEVWNSGFLMKQRMKSSKPMANHKLSKP